MSEQSMVDEVIPPEMKAWIDHASYEQLLSRWRFEPAGSRWFQGTVGDYYAKVISERRKSDPAEHIRASKAIGWNK